MKRIHELGFKILLPVLFTFILFKENISSIFLILLFIITCSYNLIYIKPKLKLRYVYLSIPFWILLVFSIIHYNDLLSLKSLRSGFMFILFPLIFLNIPKEYFSWRKIDFYLQVLKLCCVIIAVGYICSFLYYYNFEDFFKYTYGIPKFRDYVYNESPFFKIHPTYYTSIAIFCTAASLDNIIKYKKMFELLYVLAFIIIIFLLLPKSNIIYLICLLFIIIAYRTRIPVRRKIYYFAGLIVVTTCLAIVVPGINTRFKEMITSFNKPPSGVDHDSTNIRMAIINCTKTLVPENFLLGIGVENVGPALQDCFKENYATNFYKQGQYLTHNYFAFILMSTGIIGLVIFIFYCYKIYKVLLKIDKFILNVAITNILMICFTEDFFYRHYGNYYYHLILMTFICFSQGLQSNNQYQHQKGV